ncbi:hypothetical protein KDAU_04100 [Dictyobacter aurantiacus]|uniref:Uncharacterized protein n=1 Tax=Dictyobacter aurantiacus TaxID=1936993 RepID=A0A401Z891_9CHLR|nr:hypothetical protein KDAU_04100 [Dictyobacter aurantiacus]
MGMAVERVEALAITNFPQAHRLVVTTADKKLTIRAEGHRPDQIAMTVERVKTLATDNAP